MVAQFNNTSREITARLIEGLKLIPKNWTLTPVLGNKNPYRVDWNYATPMSRRQIIVAIEDGDIIIGKKGERRKCYPQGYGLRTGKWSSGILAIDADGNAAHELLNQLGGLPKTVSFTSGKPGRCQYLVQVPEEYWSVIETKKINTLLKGEDGKDQLLEFRWNGCQSVLPPSVHPETGSYKWINSPQDCEVAQCPTWIIEYFLNESTPATTTPFTNDVAITGDVPLYQCLTKDDRDLIDRGVGEGSRDDNGAKLARNLIGTAARLNHLGYRFEGDARQLFDDYCSRCSPPLSAKDADRIWKSAEKSNPSASLTDDALLNCIKAWQRNQNINIKSQQTASTVTPQPHNVILHPTVTKKLISEDDINFIQKEYLRLLEAGADDTTIASFKISIRQNFSQLQPSELNKLLDAITKEFHKQQELADEAEELTKLVDATEQTINLADYLPPQLAQPLTQYCEWQNLRHAVIFTSLITAVSSLHKVGTELIIQRNQNFRVPPTLFGAIVAESGAKKSPIFRATAREPLNMLKMVDQELYQTNFELYEAEKRAWKEDKSENKGAEPQEPVKPPIYYFSDATGEGIKAQAASCPDKALFALVDELAGFFNSSNQYRGGKGSDKQDLLSYFDGTGATVLRSSGVKVDVMRIYLSILGTIQPEILRQAMGNTNDFDGSWARFLIAIQPNIPSTLADEQEMGIDMRDLLAYYFRAIHELPATEYRLSKEAFKFYQSWYNRLEQLRVSHPSSGMRAVYSKAEGLTGRLALNLHILHELARGRTPSIDIPLGRIKEAINLMKFYIGQVKIIHATVDDSKIAPQVLKLIELSKRKQLGGEDGWIKPRDVISNSSKKNRLTSAEARELMVQATKSGFGEIRGTGTRLEFRAFTKPAGFAGESWINAGQTKKAESIDDTGLTKTAGESWSNMGQPNMTESIYNTEPKNTAGFAGESWSTAGQTKMTESIDDTGLTKTAGESWPNMGQPNMTESIYNTESKNTAIDIGQKTVSKNEPQKDIAPLQSEHIQEIKLVDQGGVVVHRHQQNATSVDTQEEEAAGSLTSIDQLNDQLNSNFETEVVAGKHQQNAASVDTQEKETTDSITDNDQQNEPLNSQLDDQLNKQPANGLANQNSCVDPAREQGSRGAEGNEGTLSPAPLPPRPALGVSAIDLCPAAGHHAKLSWQTTRFAVGDTVAAADPYEMKYSWRGEVKEISADSAEVLVYWSEREGKPGSPCEKHEASYLRLVKSHE